jgi:hypothetical protein
VGDVGDSMRFGGGGVKLSGSVANGATGGARSISVSGKVGSVDF